MKTLLECFKKLDKLHLAKTIIVNSENDLFKIPFPYYMKVSISEHKLEKKAVLKIDTQSNAKKEYLRLKKQFPNNPVVIQEQISGVEMIIGIKEDKTFEKLILIGFGGTNAEVLKDVQFRAIPVNKEEILKAVLELKLYPTLYKRKKYAIDKFVNLAYEISKMDFKELDLNPVILTENDCFIVDARGDW
ncbi:MAG: acetate--CoA ligase family protein [Candidatus Pacearchaeota archaeon]|jgi:hypothetical protein